MPAPSPDPIFWKRKLAAFLHDPPHKPFRIAGHEDARKSFWLEAGLDEEEFRGIFERDVDHIAAAADRMIFPAPGPSGVKTDWKTDTDCAFHHPLSGERMMPDRIHATPTVAEEQVHSAQQGCGIKDSDSWEIRWWKTWRSWPELAARKHPLLAYLAADTRVPNHTIWHHNGLVSALSTCDAGRAFLLFQIGPVQDFIKQARSTRDLWAGSYLLSYLISRAMFAVAQAVGPESIIYPQLRGVPLIDWFSKEAKFWSDEKRAAFKRDGTRTELLTPNLPNRFLALVPKGWRSDKGETIAEVATAAVRGAWSNVAGKVHSAIDAKLGNDFQSWDVFWEAQTSRFPVVDYVIHDWEDTATALAGAEKGLPPLHGGWQHHPLRDAFTWALEKIAPEHRDARCYRHRSWKEGNEWRSQLLRHDGNPLLEGELPHISNQGFVWALHYAATDWRFAAAKNGRSFASWPGKLGVEKDHLDGRSEVLGGERHAAFWQAVRETKWAEHAPVNLFKGRQEYGALTTIKRLFPYVWLPEALNSRPPRFESVPGIAGIVEAIEADERDDVSQKPAYYAILAMDGDDMGKWVSGARTPCWKDILSGKRDDPKTPLGYFAQHWKDGWERIKAPLTPSFHAALSEALGNFSLYCAGQIVEAFDGQLIYAGGDDVLAMLPAEQAVDCAIALQLVFRGMDPATTGAPRAVQMKLDQLFAFPAPGFIRCLKGTSDKEHARPNWPLMVMGPASTASVGIAIGHVRTPMQDVVEAAREAEHSAKSVDQKGALCMNVLKRSGESVQFAARFDDGACGVWDELGACRNDQSGRFIYRFLQKLKPLLLTVRDGRQTWVDEWQTKNGDLTEIIKAELAHSIAAQAGDAPFGKDIQATLRRWAPALFSLTPANFLHFWMARAFLNRLDPTGKNNNS